MQEMRVSFHTDALAIQTWGQKVDAVIFQFPPTVKLTALIAPTHLNANVTNFAFFSMTAVMTSLKLDVLVSHTECI